MTAVKTTSVRTKPFVILTMIVKNEAAIIARCLDAVRPLIDAYAIVDTGSTDDTKAKILACLERLPGTLVDRAWRGYGPARTEAFAIAANVARENVRDGATPAFAFVVDADDLWSADPEAFAEELRAHAHDDAFHVALGADVRWLQLRLFNLAHAWRYEGVVHEYPTTDGVWTARHTVASLTMGHQRDGATSLDPAKYDHHADALEKAIADPSTPKHLLPRYWFYLGQSYRDGGHDREARRAYLFRAAMNDVGSNPEEVFVAYLEAGRAAQRLGEDPVADCLAAFGVRPLRAESLFTLARHYRLQGQFALGYLFARAACEIPYPTHDALFVEPAIYAWSAQDEMAVCAYWIGRVGECHRLSTDILDVVPPQDLPRIQENIRQCDLAKANP